MRNITMAYLDLLGEIMARCDRGGKIALRTTLGQKHTITI